MQSPLSQSNAKGGTCELKDNPRRKMKSQAIGGADAPQRVALSAVRLIGGISDRLSVPAVSSAVSSTRHSVDLRACCYDTDAQDLA